MGAVGEPRVDRAARVNPGLCCGSPSGNKRRSHGTRKVTRPRGTSASQPAKLQRGGQPAELHVPRGADVPTRKVTTKGPTCRITRHPGAQTSRGTSASQPAELHVPRGADVPRDLRVPTRKVTTRDQPAELHVPRGADVPRDLRVPTRKVTTRGANLQNYTSPGAQTSRGTSASQPAKLRAGANGRVARWHRATRPLLCNSGETGSVAEKHARKVEG